jgi:hypothetical protein
MTPDFKLLLMKCTWSSFYNQLTIKGMVGMEATRRKNLITIIEHTAEYHLEPTTKIIEAIRKSHLQPSATQCMSRPEKITNDFFQITESKSKSKLLQITKKTSAIAISFVRLLNLKLICF